jgi:hypothetical protein
MPSARKPFVPGAVSDCLADTLKSGIVRKLPIQTARSGVVSGSLFTRQSRVPTASNAMRTWRGLARGYAAR